jgi:hypothetical protein
MMSVQRRAEASVGWRLIKLTATAIKEKFNAIHSGRLLGSKME